MRKFAQKLPVALTSFGVAALTACPALAQTTYQYQGGSGGTPAAPASGVFSGTAFTPTLASTPATTPNSTTADTLSFTSSGTTYTATDDLSSAISLNALTFGGSAAIILATTAGASNTLAFGGAAPSINLNNTGTVTDALLTTLGATTAVTGTGNATLSGIVSGAGGLTLASGYTGTLTLGAQNTYTGVTTVNGGRLSLGTFSTFVNSSLLINGGTVSLAVDNSLFGSGATTKTVTLNTGGILTTANGVASRLTNTTLAGGTIASGTPGASYGSFALNSGNAITATANSTISATKMFLFSGSSIQVVAGVTLTDTGTIADNPDGKAQLTLGTVGGANTGILDLKGVNTFTGATTVNSGTLRLDADTTLGYSNVTINNGGTVNIGVNNGLLGGGSGPLAGGTTMTINTGGTLTTTAGVTTHIDNVVLAGGTMASGTPNTTYGSYALQNGYAITATANSTISATSLFLATGSKINVASGVTLTDTGTIVNTGDGASQLTLGTVGGANTGTLDLRGQNTYSGPTTVNSGTLLLDYANFGTLTNSSLVINGGTVNVGANNAFFGPGTGQNNTITLNSGGTMTTTAGVTTHIDNVTLAGGTLASGTPNGTYGSYALQGGKAISATANSTISATSLFLASGSSVNVANGVTLTDTGTIVNTGDGTSQLTLTGSGTFNLANTNTYSGGTTVGGGTLQLSAATADGSGALNVASGATVAVAANNATGAGSVTLTGATLTNTLLNAGSATADKQTLGTLTLGAGLSTLDFGAGNTGATFAFADSSATTFAGTLQVLDWSGAMTGNGVDQLFFGTSAAGLTSAQLGAIQFVNPNGVAGTYSATQLASGEIVSNITSAAAPEPGSIAAMLFGGLALFAGARIRRSSTCHAA